MTIDQSTLETGSLRVALMHDNTFTDVRMEYNDGITCEYTFLDSFGDEMFRVWFDEDDSAFTVLVPTDRPNVHHIAAVHEWVTS